MSGTVSHPSLPVYDAARPPEENYLRLTQVLSDTFRSYGERLNKAFVRDGSETLKQTPVGSQSMTLTAGSWQMQDRSSNFCINATFGGGTWKSHETADPSWRLRFDSSLDRGDIDRAPASTGNLVWTTVWRTVVPAGRLYLSADTNIGSGAYTKIPLNTSYVAAGGMTVDTANNRISVPLTGRYGVCAQLTWANSAAGVARGMRIDRNGIAWTAPQLIDQKPTYPAAVDCTLRIADTATSLNSGDYLELFGYQDTGGNLAARGGGCILSMEFIGAG